METELNIQQAADLLQVSQTFLIKLIDEGKIPSHNIGEHRYVLFQDLMSYKQLNETEQKKALDELVKQAQELDLGY